MKAEMILWRDAHSVDCWTDLKDLAMEARAVISVGVVVRESSDTVAISAGYDIEDGNACTTLIVPKAMIVKRQVLVDDVAAFSSPG